MPHHDSAYLPVNMQELDSLILQPEIRNFKHALLLS